MSFDALQSLFAGFAHTAAPIAVNSLWQGLALAIALALCLKLTPGVSPAHRFALWSGAFAALLGVSLFPLLGWHPGSAGTAAFAADSALTHPWLALDARWSVVLAALWIIASCARAAELAADLIRLRKLWMTAVPVESRASFDGTFSALTGSRKFEICTTTELDRPSVIGFMAPRILIPDWLYERLTPGELEQIVLHESTHLKRRDDWTNLLQKICLVLFPLNPALWFIEQRLTREREMACDEAVVRITQSPRAYAACLASLAERGLRRRAEALSLGAWRRRPELVSRVQSILRSRKTLHPALARVLVGGVACSLLAVAVELARCPQLIAFVPSQKAVPSEQMMAASGQLGDAVYGSDAQQAKLARGYDVLQAKAVLPHALPMIHQARLHRETQKAEAVGTIPSEPSRIAAQSQTVRKLIAPAMEQDSADAQQVVVFTAWEQVETASVASSQNTADYETDPGAEGGATTKDMTQAVDNRPETQSVRRFSVTQLIFKVLPPGARADARSSSKTIAKPASGVGSRSMQPAAIPLGDGWFVIQL